MIFQLVSFQRQEAEARRRAVAELENARRYGVADFARSLVPVADSMDALLESASAGAGAEDALLEGASLIHGARIEPRVVAAACSL